MQPARPGEFALRHSCLDSGIAVDGSALRTEEEDRFLPCYSLQRTMSSFEERFPVHWELRPVPVYTVKQNQLYARFVAYKSGIDAAVLEAYAQMHALPEVAIKGGLFRENQNVTVRISSLLGAITPEVFTVTPQDLEPDNLNIIYSKVVKLAILDPMLFVVSNPVQLSIALSDGRNFTETFIWPCMNRNTINVGPSGVGILHNHNHNYFNGSPVKNDHSFDYNPYQSSANDSADGCVGYSASTPHYATPPRLLKPTPLHLLSPILSESSSSSRTPPDSLESTPPKSKTEDVQAGRSDVFTPMKEKMSDDAIDSGCYSIISKLSFESPTPKRSLRDSVTGSDCEVSGYFKSDPAAVDSGFSSIMSRLSFESPTPKSSKRSLRGSDCELSGYFKSNPPTPKQPPSKPRCHSVPIPSGVSPGGLIRPYSSRRRLSQSEKKKAPVDVKPPWRP